MPILDSTFFDRPTVEVARELVGCHLVRRMNGQTRRLIISETEAYDGPDDLACHASKGRTQRTEIMFGPAGYIYIYLVYGMYWMLNIVTGPTDYPAAVLIRGAGEFSGPGKLTKHLKITGELNRMKLSDKTGLWIEKSSFIVPENQILETPRIGVDYAGPIWSKKEWRFVLRQNSSNSAQEL